MNTLVRGTTPLIIYTFETVSPSDLSSAYLILKQNGEEKIRKSLENCTLGNMTLTWTLTQEETLSLVAGASCLICLDWVKEDGTRGVGKTTQVSVSSSAINEVIV